MATESSSQSLKPGTKLHSKDRTYTVVKVLGAGGFGITYLATAKVAVGNIMQTFKFAIKEYFMDTCYRDSDNCQIICTPSSKSRFDASKADFLNEADRLKKLCQKSKSIVKVNETFEENGTAYYVMEYLDGGRPGKCTESEAVKLIITLAEALSLIHQERILHLDIKPDNIVMKEDENGDKIPVLIDFGISKTFNQNGKPKSQNCAKGVSDGYSPQEQYGNINGFSTKFDVYALGGVLFYLLTGTNPPNAFNMSQNRREIIDKLPPSVSERVRSAILSAMDPNIGTRTPDMNAMIESLGGSASGRQTLVLERKPSFFHTYRKFLISASVTIMVALLALFCILLLKKDRGKDDLDPRLTQAIAVNDEDALKTYAESDSSRAYIPYARVLIDKGEIALAKEYVLKAETSVDSMGAYELMIEIEGLLNETSVNVPIISTDQNQILSDTSVTESINNAIVDANTSKIDEIDSRSEKISKPQILKISNVDGGIWYGEVDGSKPHGKGKLEFHTTTTFYDNEVHPGYYFTGNYRDGRVDFGILYDENNNKIKTILP